MCVAAEVVIGVIEPDIASQQLLCPDNRVMYECRVLVGSVELIWTLPIASENPLRFSTASDIGSSREAQNGKFSANLTGLIEDSDDLYFMNSMLRIEPPLHSLNHSVLICTGGIQASPVSTSIMIALSGELLTVILDYVIALSY